MRSLIRRLIHEHGDAPPVDVKAVAASRGIRIREEPLEPSVSGMLVIRDDAAMIAINSKHHPNRKRFSLAHELGHFELHRKDASVFIDDQKARTYYRDGQSAAGILPQEIEANAFAAELLMPKWLLEAELEDERVDPSDEETVARLARQFCVSTQAMSIRLANLDLFLSW